MLRPQGRGWGLSFVALEIGAAPDSKKWVTRSPRLPGASRVAAPFRS